MTEAENLFDITKKLCYSGDKPVFPYVTAATGHRNFYQDKNDPDLPGYTEQEVKTQFRDQLRSMLALWQKKTCGGAPFIYMNGMADGIDQITMEAALELKAEGYNICTIAVLPMPQELFLKTIENKERFHNILDQVYMTYSIPLTPDNQGRESELADVDNAQTEYLRQRQYQIHARFLALHCHVLFAFWDGIDIKRKGGASDTVHFKWEGSTENLNRPDCLTYTSVGPIVHFLLPRDNPDNRTQRLPQSLKTDKIPLFFWTREILWDSKNKKRLFPNRQIMDGQRQSLCDIGDIPEIRDVLERIGDLNADASRHLKRLSSQKSGSLRQLFDNQESQRVTEYWDPETEILADHFFIADKLSSFFQRKSRQIQLLYMFFACLFCTIGGIIATLWGIRQNNWGEDPESWFHFIWTWNGMFHWSWNGTPSDILAVCLPWLTTIYIIAVCALIICYAYAKKYAYHYRYHRYRSVAEALRVQIFWRIAGIRDCVSGYYRSHQVSDTEWIRAALNGLDVLLDAPHEEKFVQPLDKRIAFIKEAWIRGQLSYFSDRMETLSESQKAFTRFYSFCLAFISIVILCQPAKDDIANGIYYFCAKNDCGLGIIFVFGLISSLLTAYVVYKTIYMQITQSSFRISQYERLIFPFDRAILLLERDSCKSKANTDFQRSVLLQLGTEAITENADWLLSVGEKDLALPR